MMLGLGPGERALVISPHLDDAVSGMGGTIAVLAIRGITVEILALTNQACAQNAVPASAQVRLLAFAGACEALGVHSCQVAWPGGSAASGNTWDLPGLIAAIGHGPGSSLAACQPTALFIPLGGDQPDHRAAHQATLDALRHHPQQHMPRVILGYGTSAEQAHPGEDAARPVLVDITGTAVAKRQALACFTTQTCTAGPHPPGWPDTSARDRTAGAIAGTEAAERFAVHRIVV